MEAATFAANAPIELRYVPPAELERIRALEDPVARAAAFADACRINALSSIMEAGSGHIGTSFSVARHPRLAAPRGARGRRRLLLLQGPRRARRLRRAGRRRQARLRPAAPAAPARRPARPPRHRTPRRRCSTNTGSLGMGVSKAKGFARAARLRRPPPPRVRHHRRRRAAGGPVLGVAAARPPTRASARSPRSSTTTRSSPTPGSTQVSDLGDLEAKGRAFGWAVARCDGNDLAALSRDAGRAARAQRDRPKLLIADTVKGARRRRLRAARLSSGRGTALYAYHSGAPDAGPLRRDRRAGRAAARPARRRAAELEPAQAPRRVAAGHAAEARRRLRRARWLAAAEREPRLVALDADLYLDCGLIPFRDALPGALRRVRHRRAGHGLPGRRARPRRHAAGRALVRLLPHAARQRADLQQRHRGHARSSTAASWPGSSPAARATRTSRSATSR